MYILGGESQLLPAGVIFLIQIPREAARVFNSWIVSLNLLFEGHWSGTLMVYPKFESFVLLDCWQYPGNV